MTGAIASPMGSQRSLRGPRGIRGRLGVDRPRYHCSRPVSELLPNFDPAASTVLVVLVSTHGLLAGSYGRSARFPVLERPVSVSLAGFRTRRRSRLALGFVASMDSMPSSQWRRDRFRIGVNGIATVASGGTPIGSGGTGDWKGFVTREVSQCCPLPRGGFGGPAPRVWSNPD